LLAQAKSGLKSQPAIWFQRAVVRRAVLGPEIL